MRSEQQLMSEDAVQQLATLLLAKTDPALLGVGTGKLSEFLTHVGSSSRREAGPDGKPLLRWQDRIIEQEIPVGSSVLDLGCGGGELLARLMDMKRVRGQGVELDAEEVMRCVERGVPVFQTNLDEGLKGLPDRGFDYVILEETLQTLHRPAEVLREMLRVGRRGIVSFPNFGYWRVRLDLAVRGRMPVTEWLPHRWHNTPNIHLFTLQDFLDWADAESVRIVEGYVLVEGQVRQIQVADNLYAEEALVVVEKTQC
jgi:methionine biosynthesis protein MetW